MKKKNIIWLEKYKRISILSLFCLVFGILCLSICIVGFSVGSSNNVAFADSSVTDLSGTVWTFNNNISLGDIQYLFSINYNVSHGGQIFPFTSITFFYDSGVSYIYYGNNLEAYNSSSGWAESDLKLVSFVDGVDISNPNLISLLYDIATLNGGSDSGSYADGYSDGYADGYADGLSVVPQNNLPGGVYFDSFYLSDLSVGTDSFFTYNNLNYRFSYSSISADTNYIESTVQLSWPLGSNGDTDHRYTGFSSPDNLVLPNSPILNFRTSNISRGFFICFNGSNYLGLVDISQLAIYGTYQLEINSQNIVTIYSLYVPLVTGTTSFYYVSSLDDRYSTAGDFTAFNKVDIYFLGDTFTQLDYNEIYQKGWNEGYEDAVDRNEFNFYSLFGAIYDVPIKAFDGLFNVNILGVNLKGFLLGLISLCIILFILKIVFK